MAGIKYKLYKKPHASDDFYEWGEYDPSNGSELEAMLRSVYDFGRYMYHDFKIEEVKNETKGSEADC